MKLSKGLVLAASVAALAIGATAASAQTKLRIQTHFSQETLSGQMAGRFVENVAAMSNGEIEIEMFYGGTVVKSAEIWDAAVTGVLDCDMSGASYQSGKNPAFQFANDLNGGYQDPYQMYSWLLHGDGYNTLNELYNPFEMEFVGWWIPGPESLTSTRPLAGTADLKDWKFRSPPGIISMIFANLGASPIVMDFNEIFTALETGIIDGADAANITNNIGLGLYDIGKHTNYPGFHSMPADHLACRKDLWDSMPSHHQAILKNAMLVLGLENTTKNAVLNAQNSVKVQEEMGVTLYTWSPEEMNKYRNAVQAAWVEFATTPESKSMLESHLSFLRSIGAMK
ncbi:MAG: TRAP transporter substrate-binding protein [Silicimonas sp.]|nr:TRAP transporter substrate-binding protein [Silicimonas sp.]